MKVTDFFCAAVKPSGATPALRSFPATTNDVALNLRPGELVEVKSETEIVATLNSSGTLKGLMFLPAMAEYCGKRFTVLKRMERMYQEESGTLRLVKNTVLLDGVMCDGLLMRCDRSCFFYWRESWLKRVDDKVHMDRN